MDTNSDTKKLSEIIKEENAQMCLFWLIKQWQMKPMCGAKNFAKKCNSVRELILVIIKVGKLYLKNIYVAELYL